MHRINDSPGKRASARSPALETRGFVGRSYGKNFARRRKRRKRDALSNSLSIRNETKNSRRCYSKEKEESKFRRVVATSWKRRVFSACWFYELVIRIAIRFIYTGRKKCQREISVAAG